MLVDPGGPGCPPWELSGHCHWRSSLTFVNKYLPDNSISYFDYLYFWNFVTQPSFPTVREDSACPDFSHKPRLHLLRRCKNHPNPFVRKFVHKSICRRTYLYTNILSVFLHKYPDCPNFLHKFHLNLEKETAAKILHNHLFSSSSSSTSSFISSSSS